MADKTFDPTLKTLVEMTPAAWPVLLGRPAAPTEVVDADIALTVSGAADKVLHVRSRPPYLIHLDFQAGHDSADLPPLLHLRNSVLRHRHHVPVQSVAVLLHPGADSPALTGTYEEGFPEEEPYLVFRYRVLRVWQMPPAAFLSGGPGLLALAPISAVTKAELPGIIQQMEGQLKQRSARGWANDVWAATYVLMGLRYPRELLGTLLRGVTSMKESVTYQAIVEEGKVLGKIEEAKKILRRLGEARFGAPEADAITALERITDLAILEALTERVLSAQGWQDLLDLPPHRFSRRRR